MASLSQTVIYSDNFDDNTVTGWTFFDRNGAEEIANASWVETGGRLEQQTANYDFPRDADDDPFLGTIALAPEKVGGHYQITTTLISLEPQNNSQDQDIVFSYVDENDFFYVETIPNRLVLHRVVDGNRIAVNQVTATFSHAPIVVTVEHEADIGRVVITYGDDPPQEFTDPTLIREGQHSAGVGSNNDAFAIDDFSVTSITPSEPTEFAITGITRSPLDGSVTITWNSEFGTEYFVDRSTNLKDWTEVDDITGEEGSTSLVDNSPGGPKVFYRVRRGQ